MNSEKLEKSEDPFAQLFGFIPGKSAMFEVTDSTAFHPNWHVNTKCGNYIIIINFLNKNSEAQR